MPIAVLPKIGKVCVEFVIVPYDGIGTLTGTIACVEPIKINAVRKDAESTQSLRIDACRNLLVHLYFLNS